MFMSNHLIGFGAAESGFGPPTTTWSASLTTDQGSLANYSFRQVIPASAISTNGVQCRITLTAHSSSTSQFSRVSIVARDGSTANGTAVPTEILFSGASGVTITGGTTAVSDWLTFAIDETKDYLVITDFAGSNGNSRYAAGGVTYFKAATASWDQQTVSGFSSDTQTRHVSLIEVRS